MSESNSAEKLADEAANWMLAVKVVSPDQFKSVRLILLERFSALTTRLAEAQDERDANNDAIQMALSRAEAAETRLAEVERVVRINCTEEELGRYETTAGKVLHAFGVVRGQGAESAEQLLSEMAEGLREAVRGDTDRMKWSAILAKYDSRNAEAR